MIDNMYIMYNSVYEVAHFLCVAIKIKKCDMIVLVGSWDMHTLRNRESSWLVSTFMKPVVFLERVKI